MTRKKMMGRQYPPYVVLETKNEIFTISPEIPLSSYPTHDSESSYNQGQEIYSKAWKIR